MYMRADAQTRDAPSDYPRQAFEPAVCGFGVSFGHRKGGMAARKSESRIPTGFQASDLGQAAVAADGRCALVSFITSPLVIDRENVYVLFVMDSALAAAAHSFEWKFVETEGADETHVTQEGDLSYRPQTVGGLNVTVRILDAGGAEAGKVTLEQEILPLNKELEMRIWSKQDEPGPLMGNTDVARELVNDHNPYYQSVAPKAAEEGDAFRQLVFGLVNNGALKCAPVERERQINKVAASLNGDDYDFPTLIGPGMGVCGLRFPLLAMSLPEAAAGSNTFVKWTELPERAVERSLAVSRLLQACADLPEPVRIDLFNLLRFPKSNIAQCGRVVELLRNRFFPGTTFQDIITGMSGTRANWIIRNFREGPLQRGGN